MTHHFWLMPTKPKRNKFGVQDTSHLQAAGHQTMDGCIYTSPGQDLLSVVYLSAESFLGG